jgi:N-dimethylarginine dimethylaminohydrolase
VANEWSALRTVLLHRPGAEVEDIVDPNRLQMLEPLDPELIRRQHDDLADAYRKAGIQVLYVEPHSVPPANLMFVADLFFPTPEGVVVGRPASTVRAGEERIVAQRLAELGIPILRTIGGNGTFEGADAMWADSETVLLGTGLRTNRAGAKQVEGILRQMNVGAIFGELPHAAMHLMGTLRIVEERQAIAWPTLTPAAHIKALEDRGVEVLYVPDPHEAVYGAALNFVTLAPGRILMPAGNPKTQTYYEAHGIACETVHVDELKKAAGSIGCLTGVLARGA